MQNIIEQKKLQFLGSTVIPGIDTFIPEEKFLEDTSAEATVSIRKISREFKNKFFVKDMIKSAEVERKIFWDTFGDGLEDTRKTKYVDSGCIGCMSYAIHETADISIPYEVYGYRVAEGMFFNQLIDEFGEDRRGMAETALHDVFYLMEKQGHREEGILDITSNGNIFLVRNWNDRLFPVCVAWLHNGWGIWMPSEIKEGYCDDYADKDDRVFFRGMVM
jgi:hypothetical protein